VTTHDPAVAAIGAPAAYALAGLSGLLFAAGFPPVAWTAAPWIALVPLLVACAALSPRQAAIAGLGWTVAAAAGVAAFLPTMLAGYFDAPTLVAWFGAVAIVVVLHGVWIAAWAAWVAWLVRRRAAHPLLVAGGFVVCELARSHGDLGSPWGLVATSQVGWTPMIQIADLAGPWGIGFLVVAVDACLAAALVPALRGRRPWRAPFVTAAAVLAALVYGHWRLAQPAGDGDPVRVAVVQGGAASSADGPRRLARYAALSASVAAGADLVVWPEHALDEYLEEATPARDTLRALAQETRADFVVGGPSFTPSRDGVRYHNSAYLVRAGHIAGRVDKQRLVPFAEDDRLASLRTGARYTPGTGSRVLPGGLGTLLCLEAMYPALARRAVDEGATLLLNLSNDAWFARADAAQQQLAIATLRAVETRRPLVRAAATGISAVIDPAGRTLARSGWGTREALTATVRGSRVRTVYQRVGDVFAWLVAAGVAGATLWSSFHPPHDRRRFP
jgi:apolipoprotein N-acyltransferase